MFLKDIKVPKEILENKEIREEQGIQERGEHPPHKSGYVAVVGLPNAGKSTLINRFLREKVSIVSPKPQTTRVSLSCILSTDEYQVIFVDTPGILKPRYRMQEVMVSFVSSAVSDADLVLVIIDAARYDGDLPAQLAQFAGTVKDRNVVVALNKIDLMRKEDLLDIIRCVDEVFHHAEIVPVSAVNGDGTDELFSVILRRIPPGPGFFPDDIISNESERFFASELIREAVFVTMKQEIPYSTAVIIERYDEKDACTVISATMLVEKDSQRPILIGKHGATIKAIGTKARLAIEEFIGTKVFLELHVKVRKDWRKKDTFLREIGLLKR